MMRIGTAAAVSIGLTFFSCGGATSGVVQPPPSPQPSVSSLPPVERSGLPAPAPRKDWAPPQPEVFVLQGGAQVLHVQYGAVPLVSLNLVIPRGSAVDPLGKAGLNSLTTDLLDEGAGSYTALQLGEALQGLATSYHVSSDVDTTTFALNMIADNFEASLKILADIVRRPHLSADEFERRRSQSVAEAIAGEANPRVGWSVALLRALFGEGYGGRRAAGSQDTLRAIAFEDVKAHYAASIVAEGATFIVAGGVDKQRVQNALAESFGDWSGTASVPVPALASLPERRALYLVDYPGAAQSVLGVARRVEGAGAVDHVADELFNHGFGGSFTGRINMNLREDKGYTYGASSVFRRYRKSGFFLIVSNVRSDVTAESLTEVFSELEGVCSTKPVTSEEWQQAVGGTLLGYPNEFERIDSVADAFTEIPRLQRDIQWFTQWPSKVQAATLDRGQQAAQRICDKAQLDVVIAGDKEKILPKLASFGYPVVELDARGRVQ